ncbi:MAG: Regulator of ribonuclease activity [Candidatus Angelobacter sp.]|nr:Regulator of ribonuclease activity [Candidatus Angelobacter sp.]
MFEGIRSFLTPSPKRSEADEKLDQALTNAAQLDHYFFFPDPGDGDRAAHRLEERGWTIESVSLNAEVEKVQLQARQPGPIENLNSLQTELDLLADEFNGEYDGWQVPGVTEHL